MPYHSQRLKPSSKTHPPSSPYEWFEMSKVDATLLISATSLLKSYDKSVDVLNAMPFTGGYTPFAIMVPATCVAWSIIEDVSAMVIVFPLNSWWIRYTAPPSHTAILLFKKVLDPDKLRPKLPPGFTV